MRPQVQLLVVLFTLIATVDDHGRLSLVPAPARGDEAHPSAVQPNLVTVTAEAGEAERPAPPSSSAPSPAMERFVLDTAVHKLIGGWGMVYLPAGFAQGADGAYDLVLHFHGGSQLLEPQLDASGLNAVMVTVNLGVGSAAYRNHLADPHKLDHMLSAIDDVVRERGPAGQAELRRLAVSNWSAGYGALAQILASAENRERIDAVLMADGLHAVLSDARSRRIHDGVMDPFVEYARLAAAGDKLMIVSHSAIATTEYASTTETADYLADALELEAQAARDVPADMTLTSSKGAGNLHILGFDGADARAHCEHLWGFGAMMLAPLKARWNAGAV